MQMRSLQRCENFGGTCIKGRCIQRGILEISNEKEKGGGQGDLKNEEGRMNWEGIRKDA